MFCDVPLSAQNIQGSIMSHVSFFTITYPHACTRYCYHVTCRVVKIIAGKSCTTLSLKTEIGVSEGAEAAVDIEVPVLEDPSFNSSHIMTYSGKVTRGTLLSQSSCL